MFFLSTATFYIAGDMLFHAYTYNRIAVWVLLGLALIEVIGRERKGA